MKNFDLTKIAVYVAIGLGGLVVGRITAPESVRVEERLKTVEVEKQVVVTVEKVEVQVVKVKDSAVQDRYRREEKTVSSPDGTVTVTETEERNIDTVVKETENKTEVKVVEVEKQVIVEREKLVEKIIQPVMPSWKINAVANSSIHNLTSIGYGAQVERRILGPIWVGGIVTSNGGVSATAGIQF